MVCQSQGTHSHLTTRGMDYAERPRVVALVVLPNLVGWVDEILLMCIAVVSVMHFFHLVLYPFFHVLVGMVVFAKTVYYWRTITV